MASPVSDFYKGRKVFITGASGLMGKVLLEKLLYSCEDISNIYILVRSKRGKTPDERLEEMWKSPMFWRIREQKPEVMKKIILISGDVLNENLGIETNTLEKLKKEVSILFHFAATLRLEAALKDGIEMNTCGTKKVLDMAKGMNNLVAFIHLSTAFCYPDYEVLEEKVHDPPANPHDVMRLVEWLDRDSLEVLSPSLLRAHPNSYTYSKRLAEALVKEQYPKLPVAIARPSIVTPSLTEPLEGWVDNLNGPVGLMVGAAKGVIRTMHCNGDYHAEVIPVDYAINALITIAYRIGSQTHKAPEVPVYNITTAGDKNVSWGEVLEYGKQTGRKFPFEFPLWYPNGDIHKNKMVHQVHAFLFHIIPAYILDFLFLIFRQKRFMVRLQKRISLGLDVLQYFTTREWWFKTNNYKDLYEKLSPADKITFTMDTKCVDVETYIEKCILGGRQYCMKEPLANLPKARLQHALHYCLDKACKFFFFYMLISWIIHYSETARQIVDFGRAIVKNVPVVGRIVHRDSVTPIIVEVKSAAESEPQ